MLIGQTLMSDLWVQMESPGEAVGKGGRDRTFCSVPGVIEGKTVQSARWGPRRWAPERRRARGTEHLMESPGRTRVLSGSSLNISSALLTDQAFKEGEMGNPPPHQWRNMPWAEDRWVTVDHGHHKQTACPFIMDLWRPSHTCSPAHYPRPKTLQSSFSHREITYSHGKHNSGNTTGHPPNIVPAFESCSSQNKNLDCSH